MCPMGAVAMQPDEEGFLQPALDEVKCVHCGKCEAVCPVLHPGKPRTPQAVYAAKAKDDELRRGSASGGVFTVLAQDVLKRGGVVFGAGFERPTWRVIHKAATNKEELDDLRGSKYVQSDTGDTFKEAKSYLEAGREVLYSGCPCQIAGLKNFLGTDYPNLLTVDLICHGVPSPLVWRKYLDCRKSEAGSEISSVLPRRYCSWRDFSIGLGFRDNSVAGYWNRWDDDLYMRGYFSYWGFRRCCHECLFRSADRLSEITIGDYLLIDGVCPGFGNADGVSMALGNSARGMSILLTALKVCDSVAVDYTQAIKDNYPLVRNPRPARLRSEFFRLLKTQSYDAVARELLSRRNGSFVMHLLWWVKRFLVNRELNKIKFR